MSTEGGRSLMLGNGKLVQVCMDITLVFSKTKEEHLIYFRVRAALFDHTVRGALSPPHTSRRWDRQLRDKPETEIRGLR
jgi:hypothetical protein